MEHKNIDEQFYNDVLSLLLITRHELFVTRRDIFKSEERIMTAIQDLVDVTTKIGVDVSAVADAVTTETAAVVAALAASSVADNPAVVAAVASLQALDTKVQGVASAIVAETASLTPPPVVVSAPIAPTSAQ